MVAFQYSPFSRFGKILIDMTRPVIYSSHITLFNFVSNPPPSPEVSINEQETEDESSQKTVKGKTNIQKRENKKEKKILIIAKTKHK